MCSFANKLKLLREGKGMTKKEVAIAVGVHPSSIGNLEKGTIPQADLLYKLSKLFNVSMEYLIDSTLTQEIELTQSIDTQKMTLLNLYDQLDEQDQEEIIGIINLKLTTSKRYSNKISGKLSLSHDQADGNKRA